MLISILLMTVITAGGLSVSYVIDDDAPLMWRLATGSIIGCAIFGTVAFALALIFGLNIGVVIAALIIATLPVLLLRSDERRRRLRKDWVNAKGKLQGASTKKAWRFAYYAFFFLLFFFFFDRAMLESGEGIFTGGSQNLGDLPFHLGAIFSFTDGNNFPPENPSFADARFSYPFIADFLTACFVKLGATIRDAMFVQNFWWAFSLLVILERFVLKLTDDRLAARIAPFLLFFSGGLGFLWFFSDYWAQGRSLLDFLTHLPKDYTISDQFRWGNSLVVLFMTQRSLLLGMPLTQVVLGFLWRVFANEEDESRKGEGEQKRKGEGEKGRKGDVDEEARGLPLSPSPPLPFSLSPRHRVAMTVGLLAGLLPLIHLHSLAVLFVAGVVLFILKPEKWLTWILFAAGVAVIAIPELLWSMAGSATETGKFFAWHFGWDKGEKNFASFWLLNTGIVIPLLLAGLFLLLPRENDTAASDGENVPPTANNAKKNKTKQIAENSPFTRHRSQLLWFYIPFALLFVVSNVAKLAPWEWDNIKVLIYWFVGSIPFIALLISWLWRKQVTWIRVVAVMCVFVLVASGALDAWRTASGQINYKVFSNDAVEIANQVRLRTDPRSMFLNAPTYNTATVLTGRRSLIRYPGHLSSHGINYAERESDVKRMYQGGDTALRLMEKYGINYVLISPEERNLGGVNEQFFGRYPIVAESGQYRVYKIK